MVLTGIQQKKVEANLGLVHKVIHDKIHSVGQAYSYDDLFQIGCIGLCKAAATDKGGTFSTYAYRLIWNEICDAMIYAARHSMGELLADDVSYMTDASINEITAGELRIELEDMLSSAREDHCQPQRVLMPLS